MIVQTGKNWISDYLSLFLRGISFWYFLSNSLMWPFLIIVSDIFRQDILDFQVSLKIINLSKASLLAKPINLSANAFILEAFAVISTPCG